MILVMDTETTGKVDFRMPPSHESQPDLVQLALILADDDFIERAVFSCLVRPDGCWSIPAAATEIHGITTEMAARYGLAAQTALAVFDRMVRGADVIVAHSLDFDIAVIETAWARSPVTTAIDGLLRGRERFCTMKAATPVCRILHERPKHPQDWKWPKLEECMRHFFDEEITGAHDALIDARSCLRVYGALKGKSS